MVMISIGKPFDMNPLFRAIAFTAGAAAMSVTPSYADDFLSSVQGVWTGSMKVGGILGALDTELVATPIGGLVSFKKLTVACEYAFGMSKDGQPQVYERYLTSSRGTECSQSDIKLSSGGANTLQLEFVGAQFAPITLTRQRGPDTQAANKPVLDFLGFKLGDRLNDIGEITNAPLEVIGTPRDHRSGLRGSMSGIAKAQMTQAEWRLEGAGELSKVAYDVVAAYTTTGHEHAEAIARESTPEPSDAPTYEATLAALRDKYGQESVFQRSGRVGAVLTWHFDKDGNKARGRVAQACEARQNANDKSLVMRYVGSEVRLVPGNDAVIMGVPVGLRRVTERKSARLEVKPRIGCGSTVRYSLRQRKNGGLEKLTAIAYRHGPFLNGAWLQERKFFEQQISSAIQVTRAQQNNAPRL